MDSQRHEIAAKTAPINSKLTAFVEDMLNMLPDNPCKERFVFRMKEAHLWANEAVVTEVLTNKKDLAI